jgi:hypothetical protein
MNFLRKFFLLRWDLPRWAIPAIWTIYFLNQLSIVLSLAYNTLSSLNFPPLAERWQVIGNSLPIILSNIVHYLGSQLLLTTIVGVLLFSAQSQHFGKKD